MKGTVRNVDSENAVAPMRCNPAYALLEVMMHELSNPVQAARTALRLLQDEPFSATGALSRVQSLETALDRVAIVIQNVQAVKDSSVSLPASVLSDRLLADILSECSALQIQTAVSEWPSEIVNLKLHGAAIPILVSNWAVGTTTENKVLRLTLTHNENDWVLRARVRDGEDTFVSRECSATAIASYPAAIGEFMQSAGGSAFTKEDDFGTFEIALNIETWT